MGDIAKLISAILIGGLIGGIAAFLLIGSVILGAALVAALVLWFRLLIYLVRHSRSEPLMSGLGFVLWAAPFAIAGYYFLDYARPVFLYGAEFRSVAEVRRTCERYVEVAGSRMSAADVEQIRALYPGKNYEPIYICARVLSSGFGSEIGPSLSEETALTLCSMRWEGEDEWAPPTKASGLPPNKNSAEVRFAETLICRNAKKARELHQRWKTHGFANVEEEDRYNSWSRASYGARKSFAEQNPNPVEPFWAEYQCTINGKLSCSGFLNWIGIGSPMRNG